MAACPTPSCPAFSGSANRTPARCCTARWRSSGRPAMRLLDHDEPIDPEVAASLDAIDAVLAGEPVAPEYAELAEIALLLTGERPQVRPTFAERMDERVARRFAQVPPSAARKPRRSMAGFWQAAGAMAAGVAVIV